MKIYQIYEKELFRNDEMIILFYILIIYQIFQIIRELSLKFSSILKDISKSEEFKWKFIKSTKKNYF